MDSSEYKKVASPEDLRLSYGETHTHLRESTTVYFKGSSMLGAVVGVALGYLFKVPLSALHSRMISATVLVMILLWYVCSFEALKIDTNLTRRIKELSEALLIPFEERAYRSVKVIVISALIGVAPVLAIFAYLFFVPPQSA